MKGDLFINGIDASELGIEMGTGFLASLKSPASLKDFVENDDPTKDGKEVIFGSPKLASRELTLSFVICGDSAQDHIQKYNAFIRILQRGKISISAPIVGTEIYHFKYSGVSGGYSMSKDLTTSKLAVRFEEPNPANRTPEGAGYLITSNNLALVTADDEVFYLPEQYQVKFTGPRIDEILTDAKVSLPRKKDKTIFETIAGATATLNVKGGYDYKCGTLNSLVIESVEDSPIEASIRFYSGSTKTQLIWPDSLRLVGKRPEWVPAPNLAYEINIKNNIAVMMEFNTQASETAKTASTALKARASTAYTAAMPDEEIPAGQYNSMYSGPEIDRILTEAEEQIPNKEDKPIVENISAADVTLNVVGGHEYLCGTLTSLTIKSTDGSGKESSIKFTSGDIQTQLTWPESMSIIGYTVPKANTTYEISIKGNNAVMVYTE